MPVLVGRSGRRESGTEGSSKALLQMLHLVFWKILGLKVWDTVEEWQRMSGSRARSHEREDSLTKQGDVPIKERHVDSLEGPVVKNSHNAVSQVQSIVWGN